MNSFAEKDVQQNRKTLSLQTSAQVQGTWNFLQNSFKSF